MNATKQNPELSEVWRFVRGDMNPQDFKRWACSSHLEERFGAGLFLDLISADYGDRRVVQDLRQRLSSWAQGIQALRCQCITLPDLAVVDMAEDEFAVFDTLQEKVRRGDPFWWLSAYCCSTCGEWWLVAQEELQNDLYCMRRLREGEVSCIKADRDWPGDFDKYEDLLRIGLEAGRSVRFADPMDPSLRRTIRDLATAKPGIRVSELAQLLNLDLETASLLAHAEVEANGLAIEFD